MRKYFAVLIVLLLAACIDVEDFGLYWNKTVLDPQLGGSWLRMAPTNQDEVHDYPAGQKWFFSLKKDAYKIQIHLDGHKDDEPIYPVKSLTVGPYHFMATAEKKNGVFHGDMMRYTVNDATLTIYMLNFDATAAFLEKKYPAAKNIIRKDAKGHPIVIKHFDDEVAAILSSIPDNGTYWRPYIKLERIGN